jgi:hypothetical protein
VSAIVQLVDKPWWQVILLAVLGASVPAGGMGALILNRMRKGAKQRHELIKIEQEKRLPDRTGTGLTPDGRNPPEDHA